MANPKPCPVCGGGRVVPADDLPHFRTCFACGATWNENKRSSCKDCADHLRRTADLFSDLTFAATGGRAALTDQQLIDSVAELRSIAAASPWRPASEVPQEDVRCLVCHTDGYRQFGHYDASFVDNFGNRGWYLQTYQRQPVAYWMEVPPCP